MSEGRPRVGIILLNWNGWQDTIECLESLYRLDYPVFSTIIVDNGSTNDSVPRIMEWVRNYRGRSDAMTLSLSVLSHEGHSSTPSLTDDHVAAFRTSHTGHQHTIVIVRSVENLGFAAGCNLAMRLGVTVGCKYAWLLNNDTVVEPDSLGTLVTFLEQHDNFAAATCQIRYHGNPNVVWNCGGHLLPLGVRRYDYADADVSLVPSDGYKQISFASGCALLLRMKLMRDSGFLTEKFFFGEEDYELCHRLKRRGLSLACCYGSVIFHKVGASMTVAATGGALAKAHIYYLNRFIHMRDYWGLAFWECWRRAYCVYIMWLLRRSRGVPYKQSFSMLRSVMRESTVLERVDRDTFVRLMSKAQS